MTTCKYCDAPITWRVSRSTGRRAPIDPEPSDDGNVILENDLRHYIVLGTPELRDQAKERGDPLYTNHFQTCPAKQKEKEQFRKPGAPSPYDN